MASETEKQIASDLALLRKRFNSTTDTGRANCVKLVYGVIGTTLLYYQIKKKIFPPTESEEQAKKNVH